MRERDGKMEGERGEKERGGFRMRVECGRDEGVVEGMYGVEGVRSEREDGGKRQRRRDRVLEKSTRRRDRKNPI